MRHLCGKSERRASPSSSCTGPHQPVSAPSGNRLAQRNSAPILTQARHRKLRVRASGSRDGKGRARDGAAARVSERTSTTFNRSLQESGAQVGHSPRTSDLTADLLEKMGVSRETVQKGLFTQYWELLIGRMALVGASICVLREVSTGEQVLQQLGLPKTSNCHVLHAFVITTGVLLAAATALTIIRYRTGSMHVDEFRKYCTFLGLDSETVPCVPVRQSDWLCLKNFNIQDPAVPLAQLTKADLKVSLSKEQDEMDRIWTDAFDPLQVWLPDEDVKAFIESENKQEAEAFELLLMRGAMVGFVGSVMVEAGADIGVVDQFMFCKQLLFET